MSAPSSFAPDRGRPMPDSPASRLDEIHASLAALRSEQRRFERLGFERPQARCHEELRFWRFLAAIHSLPADRGPASHLPGFPCPDRPDR